MEEYGSESYATGGSFVDEASGMTREACIAAIQHAMPVDLSQQMACASRGYSGNASWPIPRPVSSIQVQQVQEAIATDLPRSIPTVPVPPEERLNVSEVIRNNSEIVPPPPSPALRQAECDSSFFGQMNSWIANNKGLAFAGLIALWFMKGKR